MTADNVLLVSSFNCNRAKAGMILSFKVGDTVGLLGGWNSAVRGSHVLTGIDAAITPKLGLSPY